MSLLTRRPPDQDPHPRPRPRSRLRLPHLPHHHPVRSLLGLFLLWKSCLLLVAVASPGPGYDSSAGLLRLPAAAPAAAAPGSGHAREWPAVALRAVVAKLLRWDALYFVSASQRGYLFEQEWAFGWGFTRLVAACTTLVKAVGLSGAGAGLEAPVAVAIAHASHLLSVLAVFGLTRALFPNASAAFAFKAASLHILSPAGLFLSAPYAESSCALLSLVGCLVFTHSLVHAGPNTAAHDVLVVGAGICFGLATTLRSNGILNGLLLLEDACRTLDDLRHGLRLHAIRRLLAAGVGGMSVAAGFLVPQYLAYSEYCAGPDPMARPWCGRALPSIYTFVQEHYWNCGFLRYWTGSNAPLFLLAAPMFAVLTASSWWVLTLGNPSSSLEPRSRQILRNLAVSQLFLALFTLTTAHVQIITRISSAHPVWLWYGSGAPKNAKTLLERYLVKFMVMYALIQGALFASFLPPA